MICKFPFFHKIMIGMSSLIFFIACDPISSSYDSRFKEIEVQNRCLQEVEILLPKNSLKDSVVKLKAFRDTLVNVGVFDEYLRVRWDYDNEVWFEVSEVIRVDDCGF